LLAHISQCVPFTPNWKSIKQIIDVSDDRTIKTYFKYLEDAYIIRAIQSNSKGLHRLQNPEKIFLNNTNQLYTLTPSPNIGNVRETFFLAMMSHSHDVSVAKGADFIIDNHIYIEVGGKNKDRSQIYHLDNAYLALDNIEHGTGQRIPLWLFGFLY
jgi:predicted AAA+ superfamily ATPase